MAAISDPNICYKKRNLTNKINVLSTIKILKNSSKKIYTLFFSSEFVFNGKKKNFLREIKLDQ